MDKKIRLSKLPTFQPVNEEQFEDLADPAQVTTVRVCVQIFQEVWVSQAIEVFARIIELVMAESPERLCDEVALECQTILVSWRMR